MINELKKPLFEAIQTHWRVWSWISIKYGSVLGNTSIHKPKSIKDLWTGIFSGSYHHGDILKLENYYLTEWFPKTPGRYFYTKSNNITTGNHTIVEQERDVKGISCFQINPDLPPKKRTELDDMHKRVLDDIATMQDDTYIKIGNKQISHKENLLQTYTELYSLNDYDPIKLEQGSVRILPLKRKDFCMVLGAVTIDEWRCENGMPIVVSPQVYSEFLRYQQNRQAVEADIECRLFIGNYDSIFKGFINSIGNDISTQLAEWLLKPTHIPQCYLELLSPLNVKMRTHCTHPFSYLSAIGRDVRENSSYVFFYGGGVVDPSLDDELVDLQEYMTKGAKDFGSYLNDFDGERQRLRASLPIGLNPLTDQSHAKTKNLIEYIV